MVTTLKQDTQEELETMGRIKAKMSQLKDEIKRSFCYNKDMRWVGIPKETTNEKLSKKELL
jgi:formiminotetrahydrofolate cyclodeaminase